MFDPLNNDDNANYTVEDMPSCERQFMNSLIKHTAIALAIIIPLAAISAYAATPNSVPYNQEAAQNINNLKGVPDNINVGTPITDSKGNLVPRAVESVDLSRYAGVWYEIGRLPMYFQRKCTGDVTATYTPKADGSGITVLNQCAAKNNEVITAEGVAKPVDESGSQLKVTFLPSWLRWAPFGKADYWVLAIDDDYQHALVGEPDKKYLWLLSRSPSISEDTYQTYRSIAQNQGYDLTDFKLTPQSQALNVN